MTNEQLDKLADDLADTMAETLLAESKHIADGLSSDQKAKGKKDLRQNIHNLVLELMGNVLALEFVEGTDRPQLTSLLKDLAAFTGAMKDEA